MADIDDQSPIELLRSRHNKDKKDLQGQITSLKHSVNKNDKKRKKEVQAIIDSWEKELKEKHEKELDMAFLSQQMLQSATTSSDKTPECEMAESVEAETATSAVSPTPSTDQQRKPTRAQQRRDKKAADKKRRAEALADYQRLNAGTISQAQMEEEEIRKVLAVRRLRLYEVAPDGDCLYNSLAHQLSHQPQPRPFSGAQLRGIAAKFIREHRDDFLPFLISEDDETLDGFNFDEYCANVEHTSKWGGEAELRAISAALGVPIEVVQANGRSHRFGEDLSTPALIVTFHRYAYRLGEHYNSTAPLPVS